MDNNKNRRENKNPYRSQEPLNMGRRVSRFESERELRRGKPQIQTHSRKDFERKQKNSKQQSRKRLRKQRIRTFALFALAVIIVLLLVFMTPIFNIRSITADGNKRVTLQEIDEKVHDISGQNLFRVSSGNIRKLLREIPYVDDADVAKRLFPPSIRIYINERSPAGYVMVNGSKVVLDRELIVLSDNSRYQNERVPEIRGIENTKYKVGEAYAPSDSEQAAALGECLNAMEKTQIIELVDYIDVGNLTAIKFSYDDRIDAICGTTLDLDRKIRLFKETVISNSIAENAKGTIDLSVSGRAVYTP